jgi:predicted alpha/beta-hydrolase family hydrolase
MMPAAQELGRYGITANMVYPPPSATLRGVEIMTAEGPALVELGQGRSEFLLALTHGAGGGTGAPDLLAARDAALLAGGTVAMVTQPYRVKGARAPGSAARQDAAWVEIINVLQRELDQPGQGRARHSMPGAAIPLIQGGRSNGARVACRTARATRALAVLALAFPLHPPGRPGRSRAAELHEAGADVLVINGDRDPFGIPDGDDRIRVIVLAGESHALSRRPGAVGDAVGPWLREMLSAVAGESAQDPGR